MKTVLTYGTFDLFHYGHLQYLQKCACMGDRLIVGVSTDEFNKVKGKQAVIPYWQRVEIIRGIRCVNAVIPESSWGQKVDDIYNYRVKVLVTSKEWVDKFKPLEDIVKVVYMDRVNGISTKEIKGWIINMHGKYC